MQEIAPVVSPMIDTFTAKIKYQRDYVAQVSKSLTPMMKKLAGRKPKLSKKKLLTGITKYFKYCKTHEKIPSISELAIHLGVSRVSLWAYMNPILGDNDKENMQKMEMAEILQYTKTVISQYYEEFARTGLFNVTFSKFWLEVNDNWNTSNNTINNVQINVQQVVNTKKKKYGITE